MTATVDFTAVDDLAEDHRPPDEKTGALSVMRRGMAQSDVLRKGLQSSLGLAFISGLGKLIVPVAIQEIIDHGLTGGLHFRFIYTASAISAVLVIAVAFLNRLVYLRLVRAAQDFLYQLRTSAFTHVHRLSIAHHAESKRGEMVSRVTSDVVTLAQFAQWGAMSWIINSTSIIVVLALLLIYSWQLALVTIIVFLPVLPAMRWLQRKQLRAYDWQRTAVGNVLSEVSESVMGAPVIRAYGVELATRNKTHRAIGDQYRANMSAVKYFSLLFALSDLVGAIAVGAVIGVGVWWGPGWGLSRGDVIAALFLVNLLLTPIGEIGEVLDQTQTALAGWRKILDLLDEPIEVVEPDPGVDLRAGALGVVVEAVGFQYVPGSPVLSDVDLVIEPGANVAIVGETGSGKTTLAKLLCRLADPTEGRILIDGVDLREVTRTSRTQAIRMVPQDGFLFDASLLDNVRLGRPEATDAEVEWAFSQLGLGWWLERLPDGLDSPVGERGENLSVGERQLVALARAQLADSGLLILDEATSAVDAETERALSEALVRLASGRTTISVAHRLSTAEAADLVVVFDAGRIVEFGPHAVLVEGTGVYAGLYASWLGNTRD